ncbi:MAG: DUF1223 domain-containing protein [Paracoccaceae bacterium]
MRQYLLKVLSAALIGAPIAAGAEGSPIVVELYTSQGCSSCPPADALLEEMARNPQILALALHVDYWDYLGWQDSLASPAFTQRQKDYAHAASVRTIYTPQAIVNGVGRMVGSDAQALMSAVMDEMSRPVLAEVTLSRSGGGIVIGARALGPLGGPVDVLLVRFLPHATVSILHGELAGRSLTYVNTVTSLSRVGSWSGEAPLSITAQIGGDDATAVLLQGAGMGRIVAAARLP